LGEIEAALRDHPAVRDAVAVVRDVAGTPALVACVVAATGAEGEDPSPVLLRAHLAARLMEPMIPSRFVRLSALPLTANGKVDRKALARLVDQELDQEPRAARGNGENNAPRTPVEVILAGIWSEALGVERVGLDDDFFALGGHSLLATQVVSRVRDALGVEIPLRAFFTAPHLGALAEAVEAARRTAGAVAQAPPLRPVADTVADTGAEAPLSFAQERLWVLERLHPGSAAYNLALALRLDGELREEALAWTLEEIARRHQVLRAGFRETSEGPVQRVMPPSVLPLPRVDLTALPEPGRDAEAVRLAAVEAGRPFDLSRGPLLRSSLVRLGQRSHLLVLTLHHIAADGWSLGVLLAEAAVLYDGFVEGRPSPLPALPVQYADYACWQRAWLQGDVLQRLVRHWALTLAGVPTVLDLPTDRPRPAFLSQRGGTVPLDLGGIAPLLHDRSRRERVTPFMVLLAAFQALLHRLTGQESLLVGSPIAGRTQSETERLIGFFVNTLVLHGEVHGDAMVQTLLAQVRETTLTAYSHQD